MAASNKSLDRIRTQRSVVAHKLPGRPTHIQASAAAPQQMRDAHGSQQRQLRRRL